MKQNEQAPNPQSEPFGVVNTIEFICGIVTAMEKQRAMRNLPDQTNADLLNRFEPN